MADHNPEQKSFALYQALSEQKRMRADRMVVAAPVDRDYSAMPFWLGLGFSVAWIVIVAVVLVSAGESRSFGGVPLINWAIGLSALTAPIALIWMVTAYLQRASDVQVVADPLRQQLNLILSEQGVAEGRIARFNNVLREQITLLRESGTAGEYEISRLLQRLEEEKVAIKKLSKHSAGHVEQAEKIMQAAEQFERLMASNLRESRSLMLESRLMQDLRTATDIITRDLRRAGYWSGAVAAVQISADIVPVSNPYFAIAPSSAASDNVSFAFSRDATENNNLDSNEQFGFHFDLLNRSGRVTTLAG